MAPKRDPGNPILNLLPKAIAEDDWNVPTTEEDEAVHRAFIRAQESSLRKFWEETKDDNL